MSAQFHAFQPFKLIQFHFRILVETLRVWGGGRAWNPGIPPELPPTGGLPSRIRGSVSAAENPRKTDVVPASGGERIPRRDCDGRRRCGEEPPSGGDATKPVARCAPAAAAAAIEGPAAQAVSKSDRAVQSRQGPRYNARRTDGRTAENRYM